MKTLRKAVAPIALAAGLALAAPAAGQEGEPSLVPPENSAVTQYTEAFPTSRGPKDVHKGRGERRSPGEVLGNRNARRLERQGSDGREVAELAVETAPPTAATQADAGTPTNAGSTDREGGAGNPTSGRVDDRPSASAVPVRDVSGVDGSSGLDSTLRQAFGTSPDSSDTLLLLFVIGTAAWALAYGMRQRRRAS